MILKGDFSEDNGVECGYGVECWCGLDILVCVEEFIDEIDCFEENLKCGVDR